MPADWRSWTRDWPPEAVADALFDGALVVFRDIAPLAELGARVRGIVEGAFGGEDPATAEAALSPETFRKCVTGARKAVAGDPELDACWRAVLGEIGLDPAALYRDRLRLRVVPSRADRRCRYATPLAAHRNTWGSSIQAQVNWWLPLYPPVATRTMAIWPDLFRRPVANTSAEWDFNELATRLVADPRTDYPNLPLARHAPREGAELVLLEPGELLAFSGAHLHGSVSDASSVSRFSLDTRTVWTEDLVRQRAAPNVDGAGRQEHWQWFTAPAA